MNTGNLFDNITASSTDMIVNVGLPFWEIALGVFIAFVFLFLIIVPLSRAFRRLLK